MKARSVPLKTGPKDLLGSHNRLKGKAPTLIEELCYGSGPQDRVEWRGRSQNWKHTQSGSGHLPVCPRMTAVESKASGLPLKLSLESLAPMHGPALQPQQSPLWPWPPSGRHLLPSAWPPVLWSQDNPTAINLQLR